MSRGDFFFFFSCTTNGGKEEGEGVVGMEGRGVRTTQSTIRELIFFFFFILVAEGLAINYTSSAIRRFGMMGFEIEINKEKQKMMWEINHG